MKPEERQKRMQEAFDLQHKADVIKRQIADEERQEQEAKDEEIVANFVFRDDHLKLLKRMKFKDYPHGGDLVFIGVDGKRPFGNSSYYKDVAEILGWKLPNDDLSDEQQEKATRLLKELSLAVNHVIATTPHS